MTGTQKGYIIGFVSFFLFKPVAVSLASLVTHGLMTLFNIELIFAAKLTYLFFAIVVMLIPRLGLDSNLQITSRTQFSTEKAFSGVVKHSKNPAVTLHIQDS